MTRTVRVWGSSLGSSPVPPTTVVITAGGAAAAQAALRRRPLSVDTRSAAHAAAVHTPDALGVRSPSVLCATGDALRGSIAHGDGPPASPLGASKWDAVTKTYKRALQ